MTWKSIKRKKTRTNIDLSTLGVEKSVKVKKKKRKDVVKGKLKIGNRPRGRSGTIDSGGGPL